MRTTPDLLVDVKRKCVVQGRIELQYMALSYRYGNAAPFHLHLRNLDTFKEDGVLEDVRILETLPLSVRHAIRLAEKLEFTYIWTDVLCILHDGPEILSDQLNKMSAIYAGAVMTVVACDGDGADGLSGLHGISAPRNSPQTAFVIRDKHLIVPDSSHPGADSRSAAYNGRGWTFQEYIMSPRKLVFINQQVQWVCQCCLRTEFDPRSVRPKRETEFDPSEFIHAGYPDLTQLTYLLSEYNIRDLTYPGDALPAVSGLLAVLSRNFEGGFLYGLPEQYFDIALSWRLCTLYRGDESAAETACRPRRGSSLYCEPGQSSLPAASE